MRCADIRWRLADGQDLNASLLITISGSSGEDTGQIEIRSALRLHSSHGKRLMDVINVSKGRIQRRRLLTLTIRLRVCL